MIKNIVGSLVTLGFLVSPVLASAQSAVPTLTLTASKSSMTASSKPAYADLPTLSWSSANTTSCIASGTGWSGKTGLSGSQKVNPPVTTMYTLTCVGDGVSVTKSVTITVTTSLQTASALSGFEQATAKPVAQTQAGFSYVWNRNLKTGSPYIADVSALQTALTREGVFTEEATGGFYKKTTAAVKAFQKKYGIEATGFVGPQTRAKLNSLYGK